MQTWRSGRLCERSQIRNTAATADERSGLLKPTRRRGLPAHLLIFASPRLSGTRFYCSVIYSVGNGKRQLMRRRNRFANCARQIPFGRDVKNV